MARYAADPPGARVTSRDTSVLFTIQYQIIADRVVDNGRIYVGVAIPLAVVAFLLVTARVVSRWRSTGNLAVDDYLIIAAAILGVSDVALMASIVLPIVVFRPQFVSFDAIAEVAPRTMVAEIATSWSVALVKSGIALMLVRLQQHRRWARFLYAVIGVQVLTAVFVTVLHTTRCIPTEAIWNPAIVNKWCWGTEALKVTITVASALVIATDIILSLVPLTFLHHIRLHLCIASSSPSS
ncbi:hypothetical protein C8A00DRAFT_31679 [Chaetomidium leptoderma]|uniref:Rhodopsin domain-containing protein n=1 Tax=Chaetomidium leptoderma TaxID=669021 RepID=A0AAN6VRD5_9PEZI|nr:hypothetical protein C8A00DRAFT_31679 [Chaetomidium leptoderma]